MTVNIEGIIITHKENISFPHKDDCKTRTDLPMCYSVRSEFFKP